MSGSTDAVAQYERRHEKLDRILGTVSDLTLEEAESLLVEAIALKRRAASQKQKQPPPPPQRLTEPRRRVRRYGARKRRTPAVSPATKSPAPPVPRPAPGGETRRAAIIRLLTERKGIRVPEMAAIMYGASNEKTQNAVRATLWHLSKEGLVHTDGVGNWSTGPASPARRTA